MLPTYTVKDVKLAWIAFDRIGQPPVGAPLQMFRARQQAWKFYCNVRDHYLYATQQISLNELNQIWYPRIPNADLIDLH